MDFVAIDFETANSEQDSPCEIGLSFVENNRVVETKSWLIKPRYSYFNYFNTKIHGIKAEDVANEPEFDELWEEIGPMLNNKTLVAHNAAFDMGVLCKTLESYKLKLPTLNYFCSYSLSRKVWKGLSGYNLKALSTLYDIALNHHRAGADSEAAAIITIKALEAADIRDLNELQMALKMSIGKIFPGMQSKKEKAKPEEYKNAFQCIVGDPAKVDPENIFYKRMVVITGDLSEMDRTKAHQKVADLGGMVSNFVTAETNFLVVGKPNRLYLGDKAISSKQMKAMTLESRGFNIQIISEEEFLKNI